MVCCYFSFWSCQNTFFVPLDFVDLGNKAGNDIDMELLAQAFKVFDADDDGKTSQLFLLKRTSFFISCLL